MTEIRFSENAVVVTLEDSCSQSDIKQAIKDFVFRKDGHCTPMVSYSVVRHAYEKNEYISEFGRFNTKMAHAHNKSAELEDLATRLLLDARMA